jgi:cytosine deaminase
MSTGFAPVPATDSFALRNARAPSSLVEGAPGLSGADDLVDLDIVIGRGRIVALRPAGSTPADAAGLDMRRGVVFPGFVDVHTHIDKGHIWPRRRNPDGTFPSALEAVKQDRAANWSAADVRARMEFSLRCAYAHGSVGLRTHIDSAFGQEDITWAIVPEVREAWAGRIALQFSSLASCELLADRAFAEKTAGLVRRAGGVLGCVTYMVPDLGRALDNVFGLAAEHGLDLDFHVDETQDPEARTLSAIADKAIATRFAGKILAGHCCSLARQPEAEARETIARVAEAGIAVVSLPMCNMFLQDRHADRTPRSRGVTLLHELDAAGVPVCVASDNTRDPFYAYGDLDALEVYREATRIAQLEYPVGRWPRAITATPAAVMGLDAGLIAPGRTADLVLFPARSWTELLSRPWTERTVLRAGRPIDTTLPDYAELDAIVGAP